MSDRSQYFDHGDSLTTTFTEAAASALRFHWSALLPPGDWDEGYTIALLPLRLAGTLRPDAPLRHGTVCRNEKV